MRAYAPMAGNMRLGLAASSAVSLIAGLASSLALRVQRNRVRALPTADGCQEAVVTINGCYRPDTVEVVRGIPVRLRFIRSEDNPCSERVIFAIAGIDRRLPMFKETVVEFVPREVGTFMFTCHMGMYRGRVVVKPERRSRWFRRRNPADEAPR